MSGARHRTLFHARRRQAWYLCGAAKTLAGVGQTERWFLKSFFVAGAVFGELGDVLTRLKAEFCEIVVIIDFGHDGDSIWQVQHFRCLRLTFLWQAQ